MAPKETSLWDTGPTQAKLHGHKKESWAQHACRYTRPALILAHLHLHPQQISSRLQWTDYPCVRLQADLRNLTACYCLEHLRRCSSARLEPCPYVRNMKLNENLVSETSILSLQYTWHKNAREKDQQVDVATGCPFAPGQGHCHALSSFVLGKPVEDNLP